jgi:DNA polymerase-3 subunit delta'
MFFRDIIGQDLLKSRLIQTVQENRLSHAWLFFGSEGTGSLPMALAYATYILCTNRSANDSCGLCPSCIKAARYIHPDLHFVMPVNKTKTIDRDGITSDDFLSLWREFLLKNPYGRLTQWYDYIDLENKQGLINTDESKRVAGKLSLKSFESDFKVLIIWHPEKMNDQAANKLLKMLEEPPPMTVFFLISENPDQLLATMRSRCIHIKIPRIADVALSTYLADHHNLQPDKAIEITRIAEGNYLKAIEIMEEESDSGFFFTAFKDLMRSCFKASIPEIIKHSEVLAGLTRERQKSFLEYGLRTIRESLALHYNEGDIVFLAEGERKFTTDFAPFVNGVNVIALANELNLGIRDIERNANGRIVFLDLALKLSVLIKMR